LVKKLKNESMSSSEETQYAAYEVHLVFFFYFFSFLFYFSFHFFFFSFPFLIF
jgi:hypothetical protein